MRARRLAFVRFRLFEDGPFEKEQMAEPQARPPTQLYLITPPVSEDSDFVPVLKEVLGIGEAA